MVYIFSCVCIMVPAERPRNAMHHVYGLFGSLSALLKQETANENCVRVYVCVCGFVYWVFKPFCDHWGI